MRINFVFFGIAFGIAALIAFGLNSAYRGEGSDVWLLTIGAGLTLFITLGGMLALSSPHGGSANIKIVSGIFLVLLLLEHIIFTFAGISLTPYILITGILMLLYVLIVYSIIRALK
jgi:hypothetical protein